MQNKKLKVALALVLSLSIVMPLSAGAINDKVSIPAISKTAEVSTVSESKLIKEKTGEKEVNTKNSVDERKLAEENYKEAVRQEEIRRAQEEKERKEREEAEKRRAAASAPRANVPVGDAREAFNRIVAEKGLSQAEIDGWAYIINRESSWNVYATNPTSGAYGLPQSLPGHKMASHGSDWQTNPYTQLSWMYSYMVGRYGSIQGALDFWNANHWY